MRVSDRRDNNSSTLDETKRPLQTILTLCQYVINRTRHQFNVWDLSIYRFKGGTTKV